MTKQADLTTYIFDSKRGAFSHEFLQWMDTSTRFTDFVETYRDKIRKKLRVAGSAESVLDVRAELEVACRLLYDRKFAVAYEPYASAKHRGPDFSVTYRANLTFNIEVARIRVEAGELSEEGELARKEERVVRILLDKLGQMQPGMANLLVIHTRAELARAIDLSKLMQAVKVLVEGKDPDFLTAIRYDSPAAFYKDFQRLSGILFWADGGGLWVNKQAKPLIDEKVLRLVSTLATQQLPNGGETRSA